MKLPRVDDPPRYRGLYLYECGDWTAVGCTAAEVALLLEDPACGAGTIYKIHKAHPDGTFELRGVSAERFQLESGMFFFRDRLAAAEADYGQLLRLAEQSPPPCRAFIQLADRGTEHDSDRYVIAMVHPAEFEDEIGRWLNQLDYRGGTRAEGGISCTTRYFEMPKEILARQQLWTHAAEPRSAQQIMASARAVAG